MVSEEDQGVRQGDKLPDMNKAIQVYTISSSSSSSSSVGSWNVDHLNDSKVAFPRDLLPSLPRGRVGTDLAVTEAWPLSMRPPTDVAVDQMPPGGLVFHGCKQFWKAGDYDVSDGGFLAQSSVGMEHVRVHPKFLHSNATSHKWALAAFAELLDNSLDETCHGATYVCVDVLEDEKYVSKMLLVEEIDLAPRIPMNTTLHLQCCVHRNMSTKMWKNSSENNGGGMTPDKMRQCMSLGYSVKSKMANTIGQYGNGFKTSTMRLGADVIVFSRCPGNDGQSLTQSIGMLSYTFLRANRKDDIVVPMIDYEKRGQEWSKITRTSLDDWNTNLETILLWSPYTSEEDLLEQFKSLKYHGTRIVIYNLWEDDEGNFELDFDTDQHDIRLRGVNKELSKQMADQYPHSRHFLTYRCSLRSYASILYLKLPPNFRIILRGEDVHHHSIVNDMMLAREITYKPKRLTEEMRKDPNMFAVVTIGFVKDAKSHIDIQGFNVYHRNRLIKPFWRVWNAAGSDGRGVIGVLEANFVEPSHDKQGFEHTGVLSRLEHRLLTMQKAYWSSNCQEIGYAARRRRGGSADKRSLVSAEEKSTNQIVCIAIPGPEPRSPAESSKRPRPVGSPSSREYEQGPRSNSKEAAMIADGQVPPDDQSNGLTKSKEENGQSRESLKELGNPDEMPQLLSDLKYEREMRKSLELQVKPLELQVKSLELQLQEKESKMEELKRKVEELNQERIALIDSFSEEKNRKDALEETLMKSLRKASETIAGLLEKGGR